MGWWRSNSSTTSKMVEVWRTGARTFPSISISCSTGIFTSSRCMTCELTHPASTSSWNEALCPPEVVSGRTQQQPNQAPEGAHGTIAQDEAEEEGEGHTVETQAAI